MAVLDEEVRRARFVGENSYRLAVDLARLQCDFPRPVLSWRSTMRRTDSAACKLETLRSTSHVWSWFVEISNVIVETAGEGGGSSCSLRGRKGRGWWLELQPALGVFRALSDKMRHVKTSLCFVPSYIASWSGDDHDAENGAHLNLLAIVSPQ